MIVMRGRIWTALLCLVGSATVLAEPYFAVQQGVKCVTCHVNPTGGGLRNAFGTTWARTSLPARTIDLQPADDWTGRLGRYVALGSNLRASASYVDVEHQESQSAFDLDEARIYLRLTAEYFDPDDDLDEDEQARWSAVWEYMPMQFLQLRLGMRIYDGIPQNDLQNRRLAVLQVNAFL